MLHLRYFVAVAEELNFSAAARRLHMATSPLSQRVRDLEKELGQKLFDRDTHRVALTAAGEALLPIAQGILDDVNSIPWRLREAIGTRGETVFFGVPSGLHPDLRERIGTLADRVRERMELRRWPGAHATLVDAVRSGKLALTLARLPVDEPGLDQLPVMSERLGAVVSARQFAGRDAVSLDELAAFQYVSAPDDANHAMVEELGRRLERRGVSKRVDLPGGDYSGISEIVAEGDAFALSVLDDGSTMRAFRVADTMVLPFADFEAHMRTGLLWRRDRAGEGDLKELVYAAREIFAEPLER